MKLSRFSLFSEVKKFIKHKLTQRVIRGFPMVNKQREILRIASQLTIESSL